MAGQGNAAFEAAQSFEKGQSVHGNAVTSALFDQFMDEEFGKAKQADVSKEVAEHKPQIEDGSGKRVVESRSMHFKFTAEYDGDKLAKMIIQTPAGNGAPKTIERNADGTYTMTSPDGSTQQLRNVKFDANARQVTYEDEEGRELTLHKQDTVYRNGRPSLTARGMRIQPRAVELPSLEIK